MVFVKVKHFYRNIYSKSAGPRKKIVMLVFFKIRLHWTRHIAIHMKGLPCKSYILK
jgi:hypothetical protein